MQDLDRQALKALNTVTCPKCGATLFPVKVNGAVTGFDCLDCEEFFSIAKGDSSKVVIIEPGIVKTIDGKEYYNDMRIIAGSPDDVEAYHTEHKTQ